MLHQLLVQLGGIEPVESERGGRGEGTESPSQGNAQPGGGMHRHGNADEVRVGQGVSRGRLNGQVDAADVVAASAQRSGGSGQTERLVTALVHGDEKDADCHR